MSGLQLVYRFAPDVKDFSRNGNQLTLVVENWKSLSFSTESPVCADVIQAIFSTGVTLASIEEIDAGFDKSGDRSPRITYYIERFSRARLLHWVVVDEGSLLASVEPLAVGYLPRTDPLPSGRVVFSRFAFIRRTTAGAVLESSLTQASAVLTTQGLAQISQLLNEASDPAENLLAGILWRFGFFEEEALPEDDSRRCWEFHDLLMHESSRSNRDLASGATYRFAEQFPSAPAIKPTIQGVKITLPAVDASSIRASSGSLEDVQTRRCSIRTYSNDPISLTKISEFLWRVARTTAYINNSSAAQPLISRPYPAGGSINELEFYIAVQRCDGLEPGFYHYDSHNHALTEIPNTQKHAMKMINNSCMAMGLNPAEQMPDITVVVTTRLPRMAWKYERMAYRASLLHAGVVIELMYLVATDMKLAPCANGTGDSRIFEQATGIDRFEETSIAEFSLGLPAPI